MTYLGSYPELPRFSRFIVANFKAGPTELTHRREQPQAGGKQILRRTV